MNQEENRKSLDADLEAFNEPAGEYRRVLAECWGTFLLVLVAAGGVVVSKQFGEVSTAMKVTAPGLMVMALIYFLGTVSGAHLNPSVTIAFALRGHFPWKRVPGYIATQLAGGLLAVLLLRFLFGEGNLGATIPAAGVTPLKAFILEAVLTTGLVNTILGTASGPRNLGKNGGIAVGGYIALAGLWSAPVTGASMNLVRSLAPDIVRGDFSHSWIYVAGPLCGGLMAVLLEWMLKGKPSRHASEEAQGSGK